METNGFIIREEPRRIRAADASEAVGRVRKEKDGGSRIKKTLVRLFSISKTAVGMHALQKKYFKVVEHDVFNWWEPQNTLMTTK